MSPFRRLSAWWAYRRGTMLRFWGHRMVKRELYAASAAAFTRALAVRPDLVDAYMARGLLYWRELQNAEGAIADFSAVLRLTPYRVEALFYRGMAQQMRGDFARAVDDLRAALAQAPHASWYQNAHSQLENLEAILEGMPAYPGSEQAAGSPSSSGIADRSPGEADSVV